MVIADLPQVKDIYNFHINNTHVNFETNPYDDAYMVQWFEQFSPKGRHQAYVAVQNEKMLGFGLSQKFKPKPAYQTSVETTVYLTEQAQGKGLGKKLLTLLIETLKSEDVKRAYASIALPNDASIALHKSLSYKQVALLSDVGRKFEKYYDVAMLEYKF